MLGSVVTQLAYLSNRKKEYMVEEDIESYASFEFLTDIGDDVTNLDELVKDYKRNRRRGMLGWFKLRVSHILSKLPFCIAVIENWTHFVSHILVVKKIFLLN